MAITQITNNVILDGTILPAKLNVSASMRTFLGNATSANLASAVSGTTGSGNLVFATSPTITTPTIATINGSTASNGSITIQGTSNATRTTSNVDLQPSGGGVTIGGTTRNASAIFQINSTTQGFLPPVMTSSQRNAISTPATGLVVYSTDLSDLSLYNGSAWGEVLTTHPASFTSDNLASALSDENGSAGGFVRGVGATLTNVTLTGVPNFAATDYSYGAGARQGFLNSLSSQFVYKSGVIPAAEIFEDFPQGANGGAATIGTHGWSTSRAAGGANAYYAPATSSSDYRAWGVQSLSVPATSGATSSLILAASLGAGGQAASPFGMSMQTCFCINNTTASSFFMSFVGGGTTISSILNFGNSSLDLAATNIGGAGINTISVATGLSLSAGNFISGTRYRCFWKPISTTQTEMYLASAPWNSSTWTTILDTTYTHSGYSTPGFSCSMPWVGASTQDSTVKTGYIDWVAIRHEIQR